MESMRSTWTDSRLDDLNDRVGELSTRVGDLDARITGRIDGLQHTMVQAFIALLVAMFTGFLGLAGLIVTQL
jgi:hypothetical protein